MGTLPLRTDADIQIALRLATAELRRLGQELRRELQEAMDDERIDATGNPLRFARRAADGDPPSGPTHRTKRRPRPINPRLLQ
jgi:hypothetical protein